MSVSNKKEFNISKPRFKVIDLFCGAGGSSYGAKNAGGEIVAGFDIWRPAIKIFKANFQNAVAYEKDIRLIDPESVKYEIGDIDIILASPECTNHSIAKGAIKRSEESMDTAFEVIRFAKVFNPTWIVVENVVEISKWHRYDELIKGLRELNYHINDNVILNAKDFGVPQSRIRKFILGSKIRIPESIAPNKNTVKTANSILDKSENYRLSLLRKSGRAKATIAKADHAIKILGESEPFIIVYYGSGKKGNGGWQRVDEPLRTITTLDRFAYVIPGDNGHKMRMIQPEELKIAMGYGIDFMLDMVEGVTRRDRVKLMGNGVCPPVMKAIVEKLFAQYGSSNNDRSSIGE